VEKPLLEVIKHANMHCMEEVRLWEVAHDTGNMSKPVESWVNMVGREFGSGCFRVGVATRSILVAIPLPVVLFGRDIISKFILWTLAPKNRHVARDDVGRYTQGNLHAMLLKPVYNA
jgi:hypothetical protein